MSSFDIIILVREVRFNCRRIKRVYYFITGSLLLLLLGGGVALDLRLYLILGGSVFECRILIKVLCDVLSLWWRRICRGGEWVLEGVLVSWLVDEINCVFLGDRGVIHRTSLALLLLVCIDSFIGWDLSNSCSFISLCTISYVSDGTYVMNCVVLHSVNSCESPYE